MRLLLAANNQATRRNEIIKSYLQLGSSSNQYAPRLPQQETKSSTKQLPPTDPILGPENLLKTGFAQKGLPSTQINQSKVLFKQQAFNATGEDRLWESNSIYLSNPKMGIKQIEQFSDILRILRFLRSRLESQSWNSFNPFPIVNGVPAGVPTPPDSGKTPQLKTSKLGQNWQNGSFV